MFVKRTSAEEPYLQTANTISFEVSIRNGSIIIDSVSPAKRAIKSVNGTQVFVKRAQKCTQRGSKYFVLKIDTATHCNKQKGPNNSLTCYFKATLSEKFGGTVVILPKIGQRGQHKIVL